MQIKAHYQQPINIIGQQIPQISVPTKQIQAPVSQQQSATIKRIEKYSYDINKELGSGSYSEVYLGKEEATGKKVAIKVMNLNSLKNSFVYNLVLSEMTTMKSFKHKNIVRLHEVLQTANNLYMVLEYCNQGDLRKLLNEKKRLPEAEAIRIMHEIVQGYQDILNHHIIHRDIKPENILINDGVCKIADFGFAKALSNQNEQMKSVPVGTPLYCSPQVMEEKVFYILNTLFSNIWSLGIIFYEMLYGATPWPCSGFDDLKQQMAMFPYIRYPSNRAISQSAFNFIHNSLQFEENKRMGWEEVVNHEIFSSLLSVPTQVGQEVKSATQIHEHKHKNKAHKDHKHKKDKIEKKETKITTEIISKGQIENKKEFKLTKTEGFYEEYSPKRLKRPPQIQTIPVQQQQQAPYSQQNIKQQQSSPSQRLKKLQQSPLVQTKRPESAIAPSKHYQIKQTIYLFLHFANSLENQSSQLNQQQQTPEKSQFSVAVSQYKEPNESPQIEESKESALSLSPKIKQRPFPSSPLKKLSLKLIPSVSSEQDLYWKNNEIISFNLNYLNILNLLKNLSDVTSFFPPNLSQSKLSYSILKHLLIKIAPLNNIPSLLNATSPQSNPLDIDNVESYVESSTFQMYYKKISYYYNSYEQQLQTLTEILQPVMPKLKKDKLFSEIYCYPMKDSQKFYQQLIPFIFNLIMELNSQIQQELDAMEIQLPILGDDIRLITKNQENSVLLLAFLIKYLQIAKANSVFFNDIANLSQVVNFSQIFLEANVNVTVKFYQNLQKKIQTLNQALIE